MQLRGQTLRSTATQTVTLPRPDGTEWSFVIRPLPLGFHRRLRERGLTPPLPPLRVARDSSGRPIRDESGAPVTTDDASDSRYLNELESYHQRVAVLAVVESLRADPSVTFDAADPGSQGTPAEWIRYADELHAELETAGFAAGDLILLCRSICRLSNLIGEHLQQVRGNF